MIPGPSKELLRYWNKVLASYGLSMWAGMPRRCIYVNPRRLHLFVEVIADRHSGTGGGWRVTNFRFGYEELRGVTDSRGNSKRGRRDRKYANNAERQRAYRQRKAAAAWREEAARNI